MWGVLKCYEIPQYDSNSIISMQNNLHEQFCLQALYYNLPVLQLAPVSPTIAPTVWETVWHIACRDNFANRPKAHLTTFMATMCLFTVEPGRSH